MGFNTDLLAYAQAFKAMTAPLGDYAPKCRLLLVDYKDGSGADYSQEIAVGTHAHTSDKRLVRLVMEQYAGMGLTVSAITEMSDTPRPLYIRPGFLEECMADRDIPIPADMEGAMEFAGIHPVNWEELAHGG